MLKSWIKNNFKRMYTINYVLLFISGFVYLGYLYYYSQQNINKTKISTAINTNPRLVIIIMIVSTNTLVGWYFWTHKQQLLNKFKSMIGLILTQLVCQLVLCNFAVFVSSLLLLLGSFLNKRSFKDKKSLSISFIIFLIFVIFLYIFSFYFLYQISILKK